MLTHIALSLSLTFLIYPFHGEELFIVKGTHISNLTAKALEGDRRFKMCYHDIPEKGKRILSLRMTETNDALHTTKCLTV